MAELYFDIKANWEEVVRLREECKRLEEQILATAKATGSLDGTSELQKNLTETNEKLNDLVGNAAKAGAEMNNNLQNSLRASATSADRFADVLSSVRGGLEDFIESKRKSGELDDETATKLNRLVGVFSVVQNGINAIRNAQSSANVQTSAGTAATATYATAQTAASAATNAATVSVKGLNAAMAANPIGIALSVLPLAISLIERFSNINGDATLSTAEFNAEVNKEVGHLDELISTLNSTGRGTKAHRDALYEVNEMCVEYNTSLINENDTLEQQKKKYEELTLAIRSATAEKIRGKYIENARTTAGKIDEASLNRLKSAAKRATYHEATFEGKTNKFYKSETIRNADNTVWELFAAQAQQIADNLKGLSGEEYDAAFNEATKELSISLTSATGATQKEVEGFRLAITNYLTEVADTAKALDNRERRINSTANAFNPRKDKKEQLDLGHASFNEVESEWDEITASLAKATSETFENIANDSIREVNQQMNEDYINILKERGDEVLVALKEKAVHGSRGELKERKRRLENKIDDLDENSDQLEDYLELVRAIDAELKTRKGPDTQKKSGSNDKERQAQLKQDKLSMKYSETLRKQQEDRARETIDLFYEGEQARIDAMEDGTEKTIEQMKLDHTKQKEQLRRDFVDLREEKIKMARALYEANPENYDEQGKLKLAFTYDVGDSRFDATDEEVNTYRAKQEEEDNKYMRARSKVLLGQYKDYNTQRVELEEKYDSDISLIRMERDKASEADKTKYDAAIIQAEKEKNSAILQLDMRYGDKVKKAFGDVSKMTTEEVAESIETLESLLNDGTVRSEENIESIQNALKNLRSVSEDMSFDGLMKNFSKAIGENGKKGLVQQFKNIKDAWGKMSQEQKWSAIGGWVGDIAGGLGQAAEYMSQIADATGNEGLKESAEQMSAVAQTFSAAAKGAASGGWVGAIVGGVTDIIGQTISSFTEAEVQTAIMKKNAEDFANALQLAALTVDKTDFESIFGADRMRLANEYAKKMTESLRTYGDAMNDLNRKTNEYTMRYYGMGSAERGLKRMRDRGKELLGIRDMMIKTLDRSGWSNFWGKSDEYTRLEDLAPELFNGEELNLEALKQFLDTNTQISDEQRSQLQNLLDIREAYEENKKALEDYLSGLFGNMASDLAQATIDGIRDGSEIGVQYMRDNMLNAITSLEQQLVQGVYNSYLSKYQQRFMDTIEGGGGEEDLLGLYAEMFSGMDDTIKKATLAAEQFEQQAEKYGFDMDKLRSDYEENASSGSFQAMTQQMGAALEGRFTAVQISNEAIREQATMANAKLDVMMANAVSRVRIAEEIQNVQAMALIELQAINRNTRPLANMAEEISTIRSKVERL